MSCNEWEAGTFKLPAAEYATFRRRLEEHQREVNETAFDESQRFWEGLSRKERTDPVANRTAYRRFFYGDHETGAGPESRSGYDSDAGALAQQLAAGRHGEPPKRALRTDLPEANNRTTDFGSADGSVSFDKDAKTVTWSVDENNHAVERARDSEIGKAFFDQLNRVPWTHGTGGVIVGNDEYNRDSMSMGGGGNYCTGAHGYIGITEEPTRARPFLNARGQRVEAEVKVNRYGIVGKPRVTDRGPGGGASRGRTSAASTAGSFRSRASGSADVRL